MHIFFKYPFTYLKYKFKYKNQLQDFPKLLSVVLSCETSDHCRCAFFYLERYMCTYNLKNKNNTNFNHYSKIIMEHIAMYLQDTMDHADRGFHYSQINEYKLSNVWPDLTDYVGFLINAKFPKIWTRKGPLKLKNLN